jgi:hypothetical protein
MRGALIMGQRVARLAAVRWHLVRFLAPKKWGQSIWINKQHTHKLATHTYKVATQKSCELPKYTKRSGLHTTEPPPPTPLPLKRRKITNIQNPTRHNTEVPRYTRYIFRKRGMLAE